MGSDRRRSREVDQGFIKAARRYACCRLLSFTTNATPSAAITPAPRRCSRRAASDGMIADSASLANQHLGARRLDERFLRIAPVFVASNSSAIGIVKIERQSRQRVGDACIRGEGRLP